MNENQESHHELIRMLNTLFSDNKNSNEIKKILSSEYEVPMNTTYGKEIELMCNLSGRVEQKGVERGIQQGLQQGLERGLAISLIRTTENLKTSLSISLEEALRILGNTMEDYVNAQELVK